MAESEKMEFENLASSSNPSLLQFYDQLVCENDAQLSPESFKLFQVCVSS